MQGLSSSRSTHPVTWTEVLDNVEEILRHTEAAAAEREKAIRQFGPPGEADKEPMPRRQLGLETLRQQMQAWTSALQQAEKEACEVDALLNDGEEALGRWLSEAEALEQKLAKWVEPEV